MDVTVSSKYIEGFTEECMRQGYTPEQTTLALEAALEKQANVFSRGWNWLVGNNDTPVHEEHANAVSAANNTQQDTKRRYDDALAQERYNNYYYADGTAREKPLYNDEELATRAARSVVTSQMSPQLSSNIGHTREAIEDIQSKLNATDPSDTGTRAALQRDLQFWQERANNYGRQVDTIQSRAFGGYGTNNHAINVTHGKDSGKAWYKPWTWFDPGEHDHATYEQEVRDRNNRMQQEYNDAQRIRDSWGGFSWMHPGTWFAPDKAEVEASQRQMNQFNNANKARRELMQGVGPAAMAKAQRDIQDMAWGGITADGYTMDKDYRKQLVEQNRGLRDMYNRGARL